jgi:uncharacterized protein (DUF305 family)
MKDYNDKDVEFIQAMIPHHENAVQMGATEWSNGQNADVKKWAIAIFAGQREEIAKFRAWLKERGIPEKKPPGKKMSGM